MLCLHAEDGAMEKPRLNLVPTLQMEDISFSPASDIPQDILSLKGIKTFACSFSDGDEKTSLCTLKEQ